MENKMNVDINKTVMQTFGKKVEAISKLTPGLTLFHQDINISNAKKHLVSSFDGMWEHSISEKGKHLHEGFVADRPVKLCFDLDYEIKPDVFGNYQEGDSEFKISETCGYLTEHFNKTFNETVSRDDWVLMKTINQPEKLSIHGVLNGFAFKTMKHLKQFIFNCFEERPDIKTEFEFNGFDLNIYKAGSLRVLNSCKFGKKDKFLHLLENGETKACEDKEMWFKSLASYTQDCKLLKTKIFKEKKIVPFTGRCEGSLIEKLLDVLPSEYYTDYRHWFLIGAALYKAGNNSTNFKVFDNFSRKCENFKSLHEGSPEKQWKSFLVSCPDISVELIHKYVRCFDEDIYKELIKETDDVLLRFEDQDYSTHSFIAEMFLFYYPDDYSYSQGNWYNFNEYGKYKLIDKDEFFITCFSKLQIIKEDLVKRMRKDANKWKTEIESVLSDFGRANVCNGIVRVLPCYYNDPELYELLDCKKTLVGFDNGLYDLEKAEFRKGEKKDYCSLSVGYNYEKIEDYSEMEDLFCSWFKDRETAKWYIKVKSSHLEGGNKEEKVFYEFGVGRNGKGTSNKFIEESFGEYQTVLKATYFTQIKKLTSGPEPELVVLKNKRIVLTSETSEGAIFQTDTVKKISGNDRVENIRMLNSNKLEVFTPDFVSIVGTNHPPMFSDIDDGLLSRLIIVPFVYQFKSQSEIDETNPLHKLIDTNLKTKITSGYFTLMYMNMLLDYYKLYKVHGFENDIPVEVKNKTIEYKKNIDPVKCFFTEELVKDPSQFVKFESIISCLNRLYDVYKTPKQIGVIIKEHLGVNNTKRKMVGGRKHTILEGYKFLNPDEDEEED